MRGGRWATWLWPGFDVLWTRGTWSSLALAVLFGLLLDAALVASFGWTQLVSAAVASMLWLGVAGLWVGWLWFARPWSHAAATAENNGSDDLLVEATAQYLRGDLLEAERGLHTALEQDGGDLEARLMLATLMRHTGRVAAARRNLEHLKRQQGWRKWELEIQRELECVSGDRHDGGAERPRPPEADESPQALRLHGAA